jgi:hypothetical protein
MKMACAMAGKMARISSTYGSPLLGGVPWIDLANSGSLACPPNPSVLLCNPGTVLPPLLAAVDAADALSRPDPTNSPRLPTTASCPGAMAPGGTPLWLTVLTGFLAVVGSDSTPAFVGLLGMVVVMLATTSGSSSISLPASSASLLGCRNRRATGTSPSTIRRYLCLYVARAGNKRHIDETHCW